MSRCHRYLDGRLNFELARVKGVTVHLGLLPNVSGPKMRVRLYTSVIRSMVLYGAPVRGY